MMTPNLNESDTPALRPRTNFDRWNVDDQWPAKAMLEADAAELGFLLEMDPAFVYRLDLASLRGLRERGQLHLDRVQAAALRLLTCSDLDVAAGWPALDDEPMRWKRVRARLTRREWLVRVLGRIDELLGAAPTVLPAGAKNVVRPELRAACDVLQADRPQDPVAEQTGRREASALYLPRLLPGQFQLPHLMTCGSLVRIGVRNLKRQRHTAEEPLYVLEFSGQSYGETTVAYAGEELRTGDLELWGELLRLATPLPLGARLTVSARDLLRALGRGTGGPAYLALREEMKRLANARLTIRTTFGPMRKQFELMFPDHPAAKEDASVPIELEVRLLTEPTADGSLWTVAVPREVRVMFGPRLSSWVRESEYSLLRSGHEGDTVRRLFLMYRSHANPWPFTVGELRRYLGSTMTRDDDLRMSLERAHDRLTLHGLIKAWRFGDTKRRRHCPGKVFEVDH
jgi:hypothetical protein